MKLARVFPRRTKASPTDELAFFDCPPIFGVECDEVHVSVAFTADRRHAEFLAKQWEALGVPVRVGGPAYGDAGDEFVAGRYLREGYTITSRGCPNRCSFCDVWKRNGGGVVKELPIVDGYIVQDDNLLACSDDHIRAVFDMLSRQKEKAIFSGGIEAARLKTWQVKEFERIKAKSIFFALDDPKDADAIVEAGKMFAGSPLVDRHALSCYVLIGYRGDTFEAAEYRLRLVMSAGFMPFAMLYRDDAGNRREEWIHFQKTFANRWWVGRKMKELREAEQKN